MMNYEEAKAHYKHLLNRVKDTSKSLKVFDIHRNAVGLYPDHIKASPEWKFAKAEFDRIDGESAKYSQWFNKTFKKEIAADRRVHGYNWLKN